MVITASGTATMEAAILERPMVIVYKVPFLSYLILRRIIKLNSIGMVNILLNEKAFPEFIQYNARPREIFKACSRIMEEKDLKYNMLQNLKKVKSLLGAPGAGINAANKILGVINE
jgi:lipid-A-disaccharide synthase